MTNMDTISLKHALFPPRSPRPGQQRPLQSGERKWNMGRLAILVELSTLLALLVGRPTLTWAADTVETVDAGATDVNIHAGFDGIGQESANRTTHMNITLGYGIVDRFSAYLGTTLQGNGVFCDGQAGIYIGVLGTPVDTDHFDLDLFLETSVGGPGMSEFQLSPSLELNFDLEQEMKSWGLYLRVSMPIYSRAIGSHVPDATEHIRTFSVSLNPGMYLTIADRHKILLEYDMAFHRWAPNKYYVDVGGVALGYNVEITKRIELIHQVYVDIPQQDESTTLGLMVGLIATLPSAR